MDIVPHPAGPISVGSPLAILVATLFGAWSIQPTAPGCPAVLACPSCPLVTTPSCPAAVVCRTCEATVTPASGGWWSVASDPWFWASWITGTVGVQRLWNYVLAVVKAWFLASKPSGGKTSPESLPQRAVLQDGERESAGLDLGPVQRRRNAVAPATRHRPRGTYSRD